MKGLDHRVVNIVLLTNQERLIRLFSGSGVQNFGKVHVANGIHEALALLSRQGQNLICIQERLGEMSGELLAYRIGAELKGKKARILLFGDPEAIPVSGKKPFHAVLDTALSDSELSAAILEIVSTPGTRKKKKTVPPKHQVPQQAVEVNPTEAGPAMRTDMVDDLVDLQGISPFRAGDSSLRESSPTAALPKTSFQTKLESALNDASVSSAVPRRDMPLLPPVPFDGPLRVTWGKPSRLERLRDYLLQPKHLMVLGGLLGCLLIVGVFLSVYQQKPAGTALTPSTSSKAGDELKDLSRPYQNLPGALPSFLPRQAAESDYGKEKPGWERYQGPLTEFRIFREKGLIRAIQIIDRGVQGVSPALLASVLTEIAGSREYVVETKDQKGTYLVEKGTVANGDRIIVYRKVPEGSVKAFVLELK